MKLSSRAAGARAAVAAIDGCGMLLVVAEVALSLVLLIGAGLLIKTFFQSAWPWMSASGRKTC